MPLVRQVIRFKSTYQTFRPLTQVVARTMSSEAQKPKIINREELKTEAKWLKMEKINWKDQDGKEVAMFCWNKRFKLMSRGYGNVRIDPQGLKLVLTVCTPFLHVRSADE
jgi:hypothetical protein